MTMLAPLQVGICVPDADLCLPFCRDVLGFRVIGGTDVDAAKAWESGLCATGFRILRLQSPSGERLKLIEIPGAAGTGPRGPAALAAAGDVYLTVIVDDFRDLVDRAAACGCTLLSGPAPVAKPDEGHAMVVLRDPGGIAWHIVRFDDDASLAALGHAQPKLADAPATPE